MRQVHDRVAGIDVHRDTVKVSVRVPGPGNARKEVVKTFPTTTVHLLMLRDWLKALGVTHVAMESTGVYWKPVYHVLEDDCEVLLVNAQHIKFVPGRKTDVKDCQWIAELLEAGLLRASFVPPPPIRDLRDLTRYRKVLIEERTREVQRLHSVLQDAGIKLSSVATNIVGVSGRRMIEALRGGTTDPEVLAELAKTRLRDKLPELRLALQGRFRGHHGFLVGEILQRLDQIEASVARLTAQVEEVLRPFVEAEKLLATIPGFGPKVIATVIAEVGVDMSRFPTAAHLASWAGLCPGNNESAGKHRSTRIRKGDRWLKTVLVEAAAAAARQKDSYYAAMLRRLTPRKGYKRAIIAIAHSMLVTVYHMLSQKQPYQELGHDHYDKLNRDRLRLKYIRRLEALGYAVSLQDQKKPA